MGPVLNGHGVMNVFVINALVYTARPSRVTRPWTSWNCQRKFQIATRAVRNPAAAWIAAGGGIFENLLKAQVTVKMKAIGGP
jgi:hypothetical protein